MCTQKEECLQSMRPRMTEWGGRRLDGHIWRGGGRSLSDAYILRNDDDERVKGQPDFASG